MTRRQLTDDQEALARVRELVRDVGCEPVSGGGLERAGLLEATAALFIGLWVGEGADVQALAPPLAMRPDRIASKHRVANRVCVEAPAGALLTAQ